MILYENLLVPRQHDGVVCASISDMHEKQTEEKGLCILEANETENSSEKSELFSSCNNYYITYYNQAFT